MTAVHLLEGSPRNEDLLKALNGLALVAMDRVLAIRAEVYWDRCARLAEQVGNRRWSGNVTNNLGLLAIQRGDLVSALSRFQASAAFFSEAGYATHAARASGNAANVLFRQGHLAQAKPLLEEYLRISIEVGDLTEQGSAHESLGGLALAEGRHAGAHTHYLEALRIAREAQDVQVLAAALIGLGAAVDDGVLGLELAGAGEALNEATGQVIDLPGAVKVLQEAQRQRLGPSRAADAWARGRSLTSDQAVELCMRLLGPPLDSR